MINSFVEGELMLTRSASVADAVRRHYSRRAIKHLLVRFTASAQDNHSIATVRKVVERNRVKWKSSITFSRPVEQGDCPCHAPAPDTIKGI